MIENSADFLPLWMLMSAAFGFMIGDALGQNFRHRKCLEEANDDLRDELEKARACEEPLLRLLPRPAFGSGDADFGECGFRKRSFSRRGTFKPNSQRKTLTVDQYHPLRALATLGFTDCGAPFLAGAKLPSRKVSSHFSNPSPSSAPSNARQASSQTPCSSHCFSRRQQVAGDGYFSGRNRHAAPVQSTQRMPSRQSLFDAQGRPRWSRRRLGSGNSGSIKAHCASVNNSNRLLPMQEDHQTTRLTQKYQA